MSHNKPLLTVLLVTYNHEKYIEQALDSLFGQELEDSVELIIADDGSVDSTVEIIKSYEGKDNRFHFVFLPNSENVGITKNYRQAFNACQGKYVAVLEGDDFWCSPYKLKKQMSFLDAHWECDLCSVNYFVYEENKSHFYPRTAVSDGFRLLTARDLIADNLVGNFSTCMYRRSALRKLPEKLFEITSYDWIVNICIAKEKMIGFLEEPMSIYRLHSNGVWSNTPHIDQVKKQLEFITQYDQLTNHCYHHDFIVLAERLKKIIFTTEAIGKLSPNTLEKIMEYIPPVFMLLAKVLIPPKFKSYCTKAFERGVK